MKFTSALLFLSLIFSSNAFAKEDKVATKLDPKEVHSIKKPEKAKSFDFDKVMKKAEGYYDAAKKWKKLECHAKSGFVCTKHDCIKRPTKAVLTLDRKEDSVRRCEGSLCDDFEAEFDQTGIFVDVTSEGPIGSSIRVLGDSRYKEIAIIGLDVYVGNGECKTIE